MWADADENSLLEESERARRVAENETIAAELGVGLVEYERVVRMVNLYPNPSISWAFLRAPWTSDEELRRQVERAGRMIVERRERVRREAEALDAENAAIAEEMGVPLEDYLIAQSMEESRERVYRAMMQSRTGQRPRLVPREPAAAAPSPGSSLPPLTPPGPSSAMPPLVAPGPSPLSLPPAPPTAAPGTPLPDWWTNRPPIEEQIRIVQYNERLMERAEQQRLEREARAGAL